MCTAKLPKGARNSLIPVCVLYCPGKRAPSGNQEIFPPAKISY